jgi:hypothetical protein
VIATSTIGSDRDMSAVIKMVTVTVEDISHFTNGLDRDKHIGHLDSP